MKSCLWIALLVTLAIGTKTQDFDLADALDFDKPKATAIPKQPKKPAKDPSPDPKPGRPAPAPVDPKKPADDPVPGKPAVVPPKDGGTGGGSFGDKDLFDVSDNGDYKPDPGKGGGGGGGGGAPADQPQDVEAGSGQIAGVVSAIGVALLGAASSYFAYQKKKLCFKIQGGVDPESGKNARGAQSGPQLMSNLLRSS
eukprot:XP_014005390.1 PREDICTED: CD99 molecule isoform X5 [Salmo salar]